MGSIVFIKSIISKISFSLYCPPCAPEIIFKIKSCKSFKLFLDNVKMDKLVMVLSFQLMLNECTTVTHTIHCTDSRLSFEGIIVTSAFSCIISIIIASIYGSILLMFVGAV